MLAALAARVNTLPQAGESGARRTASAPLDGEGEGEGDGEGDAAARGGVAADGAQDAPDAAAAALEESEEEWGALLEEERELHGFLPTSRPTGPAGALSASGREQPAADAVAPRA